MSYRPKTTYKWIIEPNACEACENMEGSYDEFPDVFPLHPNCRCTIEKIEPDKTTILDPDELHLTGSLASDSSSNPEDVIAVKRHLIDAGNYEFDEKIGEDWDSMASFPTPRFIDGLKQYQSEHGLVVDGKMKSGGETENMMRAEDGEKREEKETKKLEKEIMIEEKQQEKETNKIVKAVVEQVKKQEKEVKKMDKDKEFMEILSITSAIEGGYKPADGIDTGGETNMGITKRWYPNEDIKNLSRERADFLLYRDYYKTRGIDTLPFEIKKIVFDNGVNQGQGTAVMNLQKAIGVEADGFIGPKTLEKLQSMDQDVVIDNLKSQIAGTYGRVFEAQPELKKKYEKGLMKRADGY